ncbi:MAG: hypothetical protein R3C26_01940 [Calditrichia bacterium]
MLFIWDCRTTTVSGLPGNADIAWNNAGNGTAGFLPTLNATGSVALATSDQESSSSSPVAGVGKTDTETLNGQIALSWTVFDGFRMFAANSQFRALANLGETSALALKLRERSSAF